MDSSEEQWFRRDSETERSWEAPISKEERQISDSFWATFFAEWTGYNPRHIRWDSWDVFCRPNVGFYELALQKPEREIQQWKVKIHNFLLEYRIYSINRPGRLSNFWTLGVGAYSRLGAY